LPGSGKSGLRPADFVEESAHSVFSSSKSTISSGGKNQLTLESAQDGVATLSCRGFGRNVKW